MKRREEKRRKFHEAVLQTLYPSSSPSSPLSSSSPVEEVDKEPFDVTLINPEDYLKIDSPNHGDNGDESETKGKPSRAQRKRLRKKMLKEEAARRKKLIGPLLPAEMSQTHPDGGVTDADGSNFENETSCFQSVRPIAQEKEVKGIFRFEDELSGNDKTRKVKKRREAKKVAKESSKSSDSKSYK